MPKVDPQQLARLLRERGPALVLYARQWCHAPDDVVQEAFLRLLRQETAPDHPVAWLFRAVRNAALNASRDEACRRRHEAEAATRARCWFEPSEGGLDADEAAERLGELAPELREVVIAKLWGGLTFEEIAALTETSKSAAFRHYRAALERLREQLGVSCPQDER
ncbi:RNA polymerase sigma factor [Planctomycetes bacterium Pan216]|uniref:RNA polymerase sigma factor n=1 Tax=Kolteria novifilia TaxID=2527975 RepID=A0A518B0T9_9BACT|nr:RNA polymerase sigma factor [Planctomycetes bacterium Pan216]